MKLLFVHGWSVNTMKTYAELPLVLQREGKKIGIDIETVDIYLGRYISFVDTVTMRDLTRAFHQAIADAIPDNSDRNQRFACITHSTGGPLIRCWMDEFYGAEKLNSCPLTHLVQLAPANHGSALAALGKGTLGRLKAWFSDVEPGVKILNWLELSSAGQRTLNASYLNYPAARKGLPLLFSISGQGIDGKLYDHVNSYTGEAGSDGVIRLAAANLNYRWLELHQTDEQIQQAKEKAFKLVVGTNVFSSPPSAFEVIPDASHSGTKMGIMNSIRLKDEGDAVKPVVRSILSCLKTTTAAEYKTLSQQMADRTYQVQRTDFEDKNRKTGRYAMFVFSLYDHEGLPLDDFDILLLGWKKRGADGMYDPDELPKGFFKDRQRNSVRSNSVAYYVNYDAMKGAGRTGLSGLAEGKLGIRIIGRPSSGFARFDLAEWHSDDLPLNEYLRPNETCYIDIYLDRKVDQQTVRLEKTDKLYSAEKISKLARRQIGRDIDV